MTLYPKRKAILALADGTVEQGTAIGVEGTTGGELCFNTSMTGYQEIFTDPSYYGQMMMMTYPHIGNHGTMAGDDESSGVMISGLIVRRSEERRVGKEWRSGWEPRVCRRKGTMHE